MLNCALVAIATVIALILSALPEALANAGWRLLSLLPAEFGYRFECAGIESDC